MQSRMHSLRQGRNSLFFLTSLWSPSSLRLKIPFKFRNPCLAYPFCLYFTILVAFRQSVASKQQLKFQCHLYGFAVSFLQSSKQSEVKAIFIYLNKAPRRASVPKKPVRLVILVASISFAKYLRTSLNLLSKIQERIYLFLTSLRQPL